MSYYGYNFTLRNSYGLCEQNAQVFVKKIIIGQFEWIYLFGNNLECLPF